jgi:hypothetical protein
MHQATVSTVLWIRTHSWDEYVNQMAIDKSLIKPKEPDKLSRFEDII